jgi:hypothetical protein
LIRFKQLKLTVVLILLCIATQAQSDSIAVSELSFFKEGIFISHRDFRKNNALTKEAIESELNKDQVDFYSKITSMNVVKYKINNEVFQLEVKNIWGFVQNNTLFVNYNGNFYRVPVFGSICYFAGVVEVTGYYTGIYDPMFGPGYSRAVKTKEVREFLMNYYDGRVIPYDKDYLNSLLSRDEELYKDYKKLSKRNRNKQASRFIRRYNETHPVYYLN